MSGSDCKEDTEFLKTSEPYFSVGYLSGFGHYLGYYK